MCGMLNENVHRTFWLKQPPFLWSWIQFQSLFDLFARRGDFLWWWVGTSFRPSPTSLHSQTNRLRTSRRNYKEKWRTSRLSGDLDEQTEPMDVQEEETQGNMEVTTEDPDLPRGGLGFSAGESSGPEGGRVRHCPPRICTPNGTANGAPAGALHAGPRESCVQQVGGFPGFVSKHSHLLGEYAPIMHLPLSEAVVRRIIEAYIPMKVQCNQEAVWSMSALRGRSKDGLGAATLKTRAAECPTIRVHVQHMHGWQAGSGQRFLCQKGTKVPYEPPSASYTMEGIFWNLVPLDGKPTWVQSPDEGCRRPRERHWDVIKVCQIHWCHPICSGTSSDVFLGRSDHGWRGSHGLADEHAGGSAGDEDAKEVAELLLEQKRNFKARQGSGHSEQSHPQGGPGRRGDQAPETAVALNMEVLGPLQEGMHSVADSEAYSKVVEMLRKTNLEILRQKMKESLLDNQSNTLEAIEPWECPSVGRSEHLAWLCDPSQHPSGPDDRTKAHPSAGIFGARDPEYCYDYDIESHWESPGPSSMGHGDLPSDKDSHATILCMENGGNLFRPTTKDGSFAGPADEGALHHPLLYRQLSPYLPKSPWRGCGDASASGLGGGLHRWMVVRFSGPGQTLSLWVSCPDSSVPVPPGFQRRESQKENCSSWAAGHFGADALRFETSR